MLRLVFLGKFGPLAPAALTAAVPPASVATLGDLQDWVVAQVPTLAATPFKLVLNQTIVHDLSTGIHAGDEIAFLPPMSGG